MVLKPALTASSPGSKNHRPIKKFIVTTTIYPVSKALQQFQKLLDWELIVVGDKKTPRDFRLERGVYLSPDDQERYDRQLSDAIGWNCIQRRNFGFLWAFDHGADIVATVDDDNLPDETWGQDLLVGKEVMVDFFETDAPCFDPVGATNHKHLWHRGFPLQLVAGRDYSKKSKKLVRCDIQADFWNGDPDVDAIARMIYRPDCLFDATCFPMASSAISPFNSQNTFLSRDCLRNYWVMPHVGRMDDIWPSFYLQSLGKKVVYHRPTVRQLRNPHDLKKDLMAEYRGYENNLDLLQQIATDPNAIWKFMPAESVRAFELYQAHF